MAFRLITTDALATEWGDANFGRKWAEDGKDPAKSMPGNRVKEKCPFSPSPAGGRGILGLHPIARCSGAA